MSFTRRGIAARFPQGITCAVSLARSMADGPGRRCDSGPTRVETLHIASTGSDHLRLLLTTAEGAAQACVELSPELTRLDALALLISEHAEVAIETP